LSCQNAHQEDPDVAADPSRRARTHRQLEEAIAQAVASPSSDDLGVAELKRKKLLLKDEIERVRQTMPTPTLH